MGKVDRCMYAFSLNPSVKQNDIKKVETVKMDIGVFSLIEGRRISIKTILVRGVYRYEF